MGAVVLILQVLIWLPLQARRRDPFLDVAPYYQAAVHALRSEPLYGECAAYRQGYPPECYLYPPAFAAITAPLADFGPTTFQTVWYAILVAAFWVYAFALVRLTGLETSLANVLAAGAVVQVMPGTALTMFSGNADIMIWGLCALALSGSGWLAGLGAMLKVYPGWLLVALASRRDRSAASGIAVLLAGTAATILVVGVTAFRDWSAALHVLTSGIRVWSNMSLTVGAIRLLTLFGYHGEGQLFLMVAPLVVMPVLLVATRRLSKELQGATALVASLLLAPLCWWYWAPALLMPAAAWARQRVSVARAVDVAQGLARDGHAREGP